MSSFQRLWENIQLKKESIEEKEDKDMSAIRTGIGVRDGFWEDFLLVINNSEGLSQLLDIPVTKIASWHDKISHTLNKVKEADSTPELKKNVKLLKTGQPEMPKESDEIIK